MVRLNITLKDEINEFLRKIAEENSRSLSSEINHILKLERKRREEFQNSASQEDTQRTQKGHLLTRNFN